ncbi:MAG: hypothetical protein AB2L09_11465 [Coriobacteriia bacterium]
MTEAESSIPIPETEPVEVPPKEEQSIVDAIGDLLELLVNWIRQEAQAVVHDKLIIPLQRLGLTITSSAAAALLALLGFGFLSTAVLLLLAQWLGWIGALALVGVLLLGGSVAFTVVKVRSMQR